jgi:hypothetical protein
LVENLVDRLPESGPGDIKIFFLTKREIIENHPSK